MNLTLPELKERLAQKLNPDDILEMLNITSEDLVEAFEDKILAKEEEFMELLASDEEFQSEEFRDESQEN